MIAKIKVLGLRAASGGALRTAARGIVSYLQGGPDAAETVCESAGMSGRLGPERNEARSLAGVLGYYVASGSGRSQGRARGSGAAAMGLVGAVTGSELEAVLVGCHAHSGERLLGATGSSGRSNGLPVGARPVARHGDPDELLTLAEAAFLAEVRPGYLRRLAERQPQTVFPTPVGGDQIDPRLARRLFEVMAGVPITAPATAMLTAHKAPVSGEWRVSRREMERFIADRVAPETVMGFDMVCSAPKSVSLLWAVGDEAMRSDIAEAMDAAVDATVAYLEQHGCYAMVDGHNRSADGFGIASFVHDTSRADEAHLHVHNLITNAVRVSLLDDDGRPQVNEHGAPKVVWRAPDGDALMRHVKTAGYLGAAELRHQLASQWGVKWGQVHSGVAELAGFPEPLLRAFSTRHDQVAEEFAHMVESGFAADGKTEAAAQRASRAPKTVLADATVRAVQVAKLAEIGWTPDAVRALADGRRRRLEVTEVDVEALHDLLVGPRGLTEKQTTFTARDVHQAVASWACDRLPAADIQGLAEAFLADERVVLCGTYEPPRARQNHEPVFTTEGLLAAEDNRLTLCRHARVDQGAAPLAPVPDGVVTAAVVSVSAALATERDDPSVGLSDEQAELVRAVTASGDGVRLAVGPAGTGKTEAMRAAVEAWRQVGCRVVGCANGGFQAEQLGTRLGVESQVVRSWLTRLDTADDPRRVWPENTIVLVDEATQVSTRDAEKLCRWAARTQTVLVFVGDPAQLSSVGAGGWFAHIVAAQRVPSLSQIYRQQGDDLAEVRAALDGLRSQLPGRVRSAMERLAGDGRIRVFDDAQQMLGQVVDDWYQDRQDRLGTHGRKTKPSQMMAAHHSEVEQLNVGARRRLTADGTLSGPEMTVAGRRFALGDEVVTLTQAGHTLVPDGATRDRYIRTGTVGTVTAVHLDGEHPELQWLSVRFPGRGSVTVGWGYLNHAFDDGRVGGLAHAYAVTADRAEGSTMHAARAVATDSTSRPALYVMVSRGQRDVCAYVTRDRNLASHTDDEAWLPVLNTPGGSFDAVVDHLERSPSERLANEIYPSAWDAQRLRHGRKLTDLAEIARAALDDPQGRDGGVTLLVARRAELAEESAVKAAAIASPPPEITARIGGRPGRAEHRRAWDAAVGVVGCYRARWSVGPGQPGYGHGARWAIGPRPEGHFSPWQQQRADAEALVKRWATGLDPRHQQRFWALIEHLPRQRATAGIHALLASGVDPQTLYRALSERERDTAKAGAAILDYRVNDLLRLHQVDPAAYQLAEPLTAWGEWDRTHRLLDTAEILALSRRNPGDLCAERRQLAVLHAGHTETDSDAESVAAELFSVRAGHDQTVARLAETRQALVTESNRRRPDRRRVDLLRQQVSGLGRSHAEESVRIDLLHQRQAAATDDGHDRSGLQERHDLISAAIDLIVDNAVTQAVAHPARYLTGLLGPRPTEPAGATEWDRRARTVEAWRHHHLGLGYGEAASGPDATPSEQALGPIPENPIEALTRRRVLERCQSTLDLGLSR